MIDAIGSYVIELSTTSIRITSYLAEVFRKLFRPPFRMKETIKQIELIAGQSIWIILFCVTAAATVTILESSYHMKLVVQNDSMVPGFASLLILRELGAVVMALLLTSRVGAGMAAELSSMKVTEQIDALKILGIDPVYFLVVPRFVACFFSGMILSAFANVTCVFSAMLTSDLYMGYSPAVFITMTRTFVGPLDIFLAIAKGGVFGGIIPLVSCYCGFQCEGGAEGVGMATTQAVVVSSVLIIFSDFLMSALFTLFY